MIVFGNGTHVNLCLGSGRGRPVTSGSEVRSWKQFEPSSLLAREYAAALMSVTLRGFLGSTSGTDFGISGTESGSFRRGADDGNVLTEGELLDLCCDGCQKKMLPNTQSIEGLQWVSQQYPSTIMQLWSNGVTNNVSFWDSLVGKQSCRSRACKMMELDVPSISLSRIGGMP